MDKENLQKRLRNAKLILGQVKDTLGGFMSSRPSPIGFISFDLDLYSSTMDAFGLLAGPQDIFLPRVHCSFDDIMGYSYNDFTGERLAIADFNRTHEMRKISNIYGLQYFVRMFTEAWVEQMYMIHLFDHRLYGALDGMNKEGALPLAES